MLGKPETQTIMSAAIFMSLSHAVFVLCIPKNLIEEEEEEEEVKGHLHQHRLRYHHYHRHLALLKRAGPIALTV